MRTEQPISGSLGEGLRRSCHFCRRRKIKCSSGQNRGICAACKERGIDCIYDAETTNARPKPQSSKKHPSNVARRRSSVTNHPTISKTGSMSAAGISSHPLQPSDIETIDAPLPSYYRDGMDSRLPITIGEELEAIFRAYQGLDFGSAQLDIHRTTYSDTFTTMAQSLVVSLSRRLGSLGVPNKKNTKTNTHTPNAAGSKSQIIRDAGDCLERNPLERIDDAIRLQLVDVWFSSHPLSMILSKTLVLRSCKEHTYNEALLSVILADAHHVQNAGKISILERELFAYAKECLRRQPSSACNLSTAQALALLGWHDLCSRNYKRATCFLVCSLRILVELENKTTDGAKCSGRRLNGIDIEAVESELICNLHWIAYIALLHNLMATTGSIVGYMSWKCPSKRPCVDGSQSSLIKLDKASGQVSTFQQQAQSLRSLWPLAHLASTCSRVLRLCTYRSPQSIATDKTRSPLSGDQVQTRAPSMADIEYVFRNARKSLAEIVVTVRNEIINEPSKTLVTLAYYILVIHLHFPRLEHTLSPHTEVEVDSIKDFCDSSNNLLNVLQCVAGTKPSAEPSTANMFSPSTNIADMMSLGLDACGRAFNHLHDRWGAGSEAERHAVASHANELENLAVDMHHLAKHDFIRTSTSARDAKRLLKTARRGYAEFNSTASTVSRSNASSTPELTPDMRMCDSPGAVVRVDSTMSASSGMQSPNSYHLERLASVDCPNLGFYHESMQTEEDVQMTIPAAQGHSITSSFNADVGFRIHSSPLSVASWPCEALPDSKDCYARTMFDDPNYTFDYLWSANSVPSAELQPLSHSAPSLHDQSSNSTIASNMDHLNGTCAVTSNVAQLACSEEVPYVTSPFVYGVMTSPEHDSMMLAGYDSNETTTAFTGQDVQSAMAISPYEIIW